MTPWEDLEEQIEALAERPFAALVVRYIDSAVLLTIWVWIALLVGMSGRDWTAGAVLGGCAACALWLYLRWTETQGLALIKVLGLATLSGVLAWAITVASVGEQSGTARELGALTFGAALTGQLIWAGRARLIDDELYDPQPEPEPEPFPEPPPDDDTFAPEPDDEVEPEVEDEEDQEDEEEPPPDIPEEVREACVTLGLPLDLSFDREALMQARRRAMKEFGLHPDVGGNVDAAAQVNVAVDTICAYRNWHT